MCYFQSGALSGSAKLLLNIKEKLFYVKWQSLGYLTQVEYSQNHHKGNFKARARVGYFIDTAAVFNGIDDDDVL